MARDGKIAGRLGAAAFKGGGGAATIGRVTAFLKSGKGPKANFVNKAGRVQSSRSPGGTRSAKAEAKFNRALSRESRNDPSGRRAAPKGKAGGGGGGTR